MLVRNSTDRWGGVAQFFHWAMFLLIVGAWFAVEQHSEYPKGSPERGEWMDLHKAIGLTVFFLLWARLGWRLSGPAPTPVITNIWQHRAAVLVHWGLYFVMLMMPLSGLVMSQFAGREISWFGVFQIPVFVAENKDLAAQIKDLHEGVWWPLLLGLVGIHVVAALWHQFVVKDDILKRMRPF
ncbi:MAG: cytochrome b [Moraxellaceae bacterium]|jgi:cytochrome b561|nr:cytochrome b [Moraxellaceae bacterium]MBP8852316.1 cytochrome b [Moraxellaceae bacterium]MBP9045240.1 cytochrome b [Moraxellaceae bacterium]MBP9730687.1 cytochrome b [Moraxellaceae bacterium]HQV41030.1 cytochrome b [Moraxellaceae bacterium]